MRRLILQEHKSFGPIRLTHEECVSLRRAVPGLSIAPAAADGDCFDLSAGSWVGVTRVGDLVVEIRPKFRIEQLFFMLSYSIEPHQWRERRVLYQGATTLVEAMIPLFMVAVRTAFRSGILQGYRTTDEALMTVRGRIRMDDQIRERFGLVPPVEVRFDEFTEDITVNRLIKAALARLEMIAPHGSVRRGELRAFRGTLERVSYCEYIPGNLPPVRFDRLNEHYRPAIALAKLILRSGALDLGAGHLVGSGFLVDMNVVFEDFVVTALRETLKLSPAAFARPGDGDRLYLDRRRRVKLEPDMTWWDLGDCRFVGDVKYKRVNVPGVKHPDLYQLLAYTVATGLEEGLLIYAAGEGEPVCHEVEMAGKRLRVVSLDLSGGPEEILAGVGEIAQLVRRMKSRGESADAGRVASVV